MFKIAKGNITHNNHLLDALVHKPQGSTPAQASGPKGAKWGMSGTCLGQVFTLGNFKGFSLALH